MLEVMKYVNHINETLTFGKGKLYVNESDLHDFAWSVTSKNDKISGFKKGIVKKSIPVILKCDTAEEGVKLRNQLFEVFEKDVLAQKHGRIIIGDYYLKCFVTESKKKDYLIHKSYLPLTLTVQTDQPQWIRETQNTFGVEADAVYTVENVSGDLVEFAGLDFDGLNIYGRSTQTQTSGVQLANLPDVEPVSVNGITWSCKNGVVTANGTATGASVTINVIPCFVPIVAGAYHLSCNSGMVSVAVRIDRADGTSEHKPTGSFVLDGTEAQCRVYCVVAAGVTVSNVKVYPMLNAGTTALPWEPYTGGKPCPNPDYPAEIESIGDGGAVEIKVGGDSTSEEQTLTLATGEGLHGIPVSSGGNYTDSSGQQWIADEIRLNADGTGVWVQNIAKTVHDGSEAWTTYGSNEYGCIYGRKALVPRLYGGNVPMLATHMGQVSSISASNPTATETGCHLGGSVNNLLFFVRYDFCADVDAWKSWLAEQNAKGTPLEQLYQCDPIETALSAEEVNAFLALHTISPFTTVLNDAGAWMEVAYLSDASSGYDFSYDFPVDYISEIVEYTLNNSSFVPCDFKMTIYGVCKNPEIYISDHLYSLDIEIGEGEYLVIDSKAKTITLHRSNGTTVNKFAARNRDSYIFEKIPTGEHAVAWDGTFLFDVVLMQERSEPEWT